MTRSTNMEHVAHLQRMANESWIGSPERAALDAAIAVLSAPQPPAEAQPVAWQFQDRDGKWHGFTDERHRQNTIADGSWPVRALYVAPPAEAQTQGGGEALEAELIALVAGPYHYHHKMDEHAEREGKAFDRCRELTIQNIRTWCATRRAMLAAHRFVTLARTAPPAEADPFVVKHYIGEEGPTIKGNGFDGLRLGEDREEAEEFVRWINEHLAQQPAAELYRCVACDDHYRIGTPCDCKLQPGHPDFTPATQQPAAEAQAQGGGDSCPHCKGNPGLDCNSFGRAAAPPSAPVGVELLCQVYADAYHHGHHATVEGDYIDVLPVDRDTYWREKVEEDYAEELAQQPAAVDGADAKDAEIERLRAEVGKQSAYAKRTHDWNTELLANNDRLVEALREAMEWNWLDDDARPSPIADLCDALLREAAAALEAAREDAWVACSDRMPEREGLGAVLAFDADRPRKGVWLETTHPSWWGQFIEHANVWGPTITHWMPLPAPPKEARNG